LAAVGAVPKTGYNVVYKVDFRLWFVSCEWKPLRLWVFEDASRRLNELLDAAVTTPQMIERGRDRFVVSLATDASEKDIEFLLKGGPLEGDEDLGR